MIKTIEKNKIINQCRELIQKSIGNVKAKEETDKNRIELGLLIILHHNST